MRSHAVQINITNWQINLYVHLNTFSAKHKILGRLSAIPISLLDVSLETLKNPISAIHFTALAVINFIGSALSQQYTLKDALTNADWAISSIAVTPIKLAIAPVKVFFQSVAIIIDPKRVMSIATPTTFRRDGEW